MTVHIRTKTGKNLSIAKIVSIITEHKRELLGFGVVELGIFGSFVNGNAKDNSDIDILVTFNKITFDNYMGLKLFLEGILRRNVDLVIKRTLKPAFNYVVNEAVYV